MNYTRDELLLNAAIEVTDTMLVPGASPSIKEVKQAIYDRTRLMFDGQGLKPVPTELQASQIAVAIARMYHVIRVKDSDKVDDSQAPLAVYQTDGPRKGTYDMDLEMLAIIIKQFNSSLPKKGVEEVMADLRTLSVKGEPLAPAWPQETDRDLIAVNNGIFNYKTKTLMPFSPDHVFLSKSGVNYNPAAMNVVIHNDEDGTDWDVETWMQELSDDPAVVDLLWKVVGACVRPHVRWDKMALFHSVKGNNGKGTLLTLMRALIGQGNYSTITLRGFSDRFGRSELTRANCVLTDENSVGKFLEEADVLKAVITGDPISLERKNKDPFTFTFRGFVVECTNDIPKFQDKSNSLARRILLIPFDKSFAGRERKYIKSDYLLRDDVLECVLHKVLVDIPDYYTLPEPDACKMALHEFKTENDPVLAFMEDIMSELRWELVPYQFMYDLYRAWMLRNNPSGKAIVRTRFISSLREYLETNPEFGYEAPLDDDGKPAKMKVCFGMSAPEPLIDEYGLSEWSNTNYRSGSDWRKRCLTNKCGYDDRIRGIRRIGAVAPYRQFDPSKISTIA